jgi:hypothetical protein
VLLGVYPKQFSNRKCTNWCPRPREFCGRGRNANPVPSFVRNRIDQTAQFRRLPNSICFSDISPVSVSLRRSLFLSRRRAKYSLFILMTCLQFHPWVYIHMYVYEVSIPFRWCVYFFIFFLLFCTRCLFIGIVT